MKLAIVVSKFNEEITSKLLEGALQRLQESGLSRQNISVTEVPGAVEIPLTVQLLAKSSDAFDAIIVLSCIIRGDTNHYDYVCQQVSQGCQRVMLDYNIPVIFGVLTTNNLIQAEDRVGGPEGHKGKEAADAALHMIEIVRQLTNRDEIAA